MEPLSWPSAYRDESKKARARQPWVRSWLHPRPQEPNRAEVQAELIMQLRSRGDPPPEVWGDDPQRARLGACIVKLAERRVGWLSNALLPDDPFEIAFLTPWDQLQIVEAVMEIEHQIGRSIPDSEVESWVGKSLGEVVDSLLAA